jgi:hypothetical protein
MLYVILLSLYITETGFGEGQLAVGTHGASSLGTDWFRQAVAGFLLHDAAQLPLRLHI